ncbi:hypothetical protein BS329_31050 [Amycolatopsis coloradensis]|uniref:Uncharacterized protein n=1 Tax=Amycolatopsis coloradensis TaxID=76021 RepID=A0A1R0KJ89_9PSEU|nr:DegT/DnrJ/EryC1/StrS family aminotransferase [Amycolatopsis coloradensis]OLZ46107.1 hypothetical protein BS329_31050 [Amycolatopsis coloradensis]
MANADDHRSGTSMDLMPHSLFGRAERAAISKVLTSGQLWRGNGADWGSQEEGKDGGAADELEDVFCEWTGLAYSHGVNSGTSANEAAIASLGLEPGDEVLCPAISPAFVPLSILAAGCIPVFVDVIPETLLIDPELIEPSLSDRTRAVVVVHLWGMPAPMARLMDLAGKFDLKVVEDCAQAFGTTIDGQLVGSFGDACCYSFQQSKHITCGEGGIFATNNADGYARAVLYSNAGIPSFRFGVPPPSGKQPDGARGHLVFGHNHRISELQAAIAMTQLGRIDEFNRRRVELVDTINEKLRDHPTLELGLPPEFPGCTVSYWRYPIRVPPGRGTFLGVSYLEQVFQHMNECRRTPFGVQLPRHLSYAPGSCPRAEAGALQVRALPIHHGLTDEDLLTLMDDCFEDLHTATMAD